MTDEDLTQRLSTPSTPNLPTARSAAHVDLPERIGSYRVLDCIGEGGMGVVYRAVQEKPNRTVALKVIKPGYASEQLLRRFELESQALGLLHHPGIAQIFEAGTADSGSGPQPYFAMEFIEGLSLSEHGFGLDIREKLILTAKICDAVQHAHQKGVIHRDLKPGNILVTEARESTTDSSRTPSTSGSMAGTIRSTSQPKILDFGVARITDADVKTTTLQTDAGQVVGTLPYMSPEQVAGTSSELDTRSDVYSVGVILYELLTGSMPYEIDEARVHDVIRSIREQEPARLSSHDRLFRGDIETIVAKALEKDKERRYQSAAELAQDIRRYLMDEPIQARPPSAWYQIVKFARRNRPVVAGGLAVLFTLSAGTVISVRQAVRATRAERSVREMLGEVQKARELAEERRVEADEKRKLAENEAERAVREARKAEQTTAFVQSMLEGVNPGTARDEDTCLL